MRLAAIALVLACSKENKPDDLDEKMRHCPLAIDGAAVKLTDVDGGVQFDVKAPAAAVGEVRRRAHHVVEFAAKRTGSHGGGQGGGTMRNCPIVTSDVTISVEDLPDGARIKVAAQDVETLRKESRARVAKFPFAGAVISQ